MIKKLWKANVVFTSPRILFDSGGLYAGEDREGKGLSRYTYITIHCDKRIFIY